MMKLRDLRIMLVEDDPEDVNFTKRVLKYNKIYKNLIIVSNGSEALNSLEQLATEKRFPDLILLDLNLPDISGIDLLKKIKENTRFESVPVVILTGSNVDDDIQKSYDLGASTYLVKPISNQALIVALENI
ncbi:MAG: response regulator [Methanotrichaceae archaeon]|nr:response regulator [Methanotrichaceae archaeon]